MPRFLAAAPLVALIGCSAGAPPPRSSDAGDTGDVAPLRPSLPAGDIALRER